MRTIEVNIPGKIIISGEHAVVHGCPAIATPCDIFLKGQFSPFTSQKLTVTLPNLNESKTLDFIEIRNCYLHNLENLSRFTAGKLNVSRVLERSTDLIFHTFHHLNQKFRFPYGGEIVITSDIPIKSGMGSSAATIIAVIKLLREEFSLIISDIEIFRLARKLENLQHGRSSGIDPATIVNSQEIYYLDGKISTLNFKPTPLKRYIIDTGKPKSTTGECVAKVNDLFSNQLFGSQLRRQFSSVTEKLKESLERGRVDQTIALIRTNNLLLKKIGVVPGRVFEFSRKVEQNLAGAFKLCGAGSISGDKGGIGVIFSEQSPTALCDEFGYKILASS